MALSYLLNNPLAFKWQHYKHVPSWILPYLCRSWVLDSGSLTRRLIDVSNGNFAVNVTFQGWDYPRLDELMALNLSRKQKALVREVELLCFGEVWVKARSIIPITTLSGEERQLAYLGNRPLGAFLFSSRAMKRNDMEIAVITGAKKQSIYGRRSCFLLHQKPLLVSEIFMPRLFEFTKRGIDCGSF